MTESTGQTRSCPMCNVSNYEKRFNGACCAVLYGCEIWGIKKLQYLETVQNSFAKLVLSVRKQTPNQTGVFL